MTAATIKHATLTNAAEDTTALVDGPKWDAAHTLSGPWTPDQGGTGIANNAASTVTISGAYAITITLTATTGLTFPTSGTLATLAGTEALTNKTVNNVTITAPASSATLTIPDGVTLTGPASSGTAMTLGNAETVTGAKTFGSAGAVGKLKVAGTTSGSTILDATAIASGTLTLPAATDTLVGKATTDILTNKTVNLTSNTLSGTTAQFNTALSDNDFATLAGSETLTNKTIGAATLSGTVSGGGNQINNVVIGASTPLAGSFTTVAASTSVIVTAASSTSMLASLSGNAANYATMSVGRASVDGYFFAAAAANQFTTGTIAGDIGYTAAGAGNSVWFIAGGSQPAFKAGPTGQVTMLQTTASISPGTGGIISLGGFGAADSIFAGNMIRSVSATGGLGYGTGAGGTVTQATSKATGVTLSTVCGAITMNNAALAAATIVSFVATNTAIAATDVLILNHISGGTPGAYTLNARCAAGSATIDVRNNTAGSLSEAIVIQYALIKGVNA